MSTAEVIEAGMRAWFHGTPQAPYSAPGHTSDPIECWHCLEAAEVAARMTDEASDGAS